jgi:hypothetical protein
MSPASTSLDPDVAKPTFPPSCRHSEPSGAPMNVIAPFYCAPDWTVRRSDPYGGRAMGSRPIFGADSHRSRISASSLRSIKSASLPDIARGRGCGSSSSPHCVTSSRRIDTRRRAANRRVRAQPRGLPTGCGGVNRTSACNRCRIRSPILLPPAGSAFGTARTRSAASCWRARVPARRSRRACRSVAC